MSGLFNCRLGRGERSVGGRNEIHVVGINLNLIREAGSKAATRGRKLDKNSATTEAVC